MNLVNGSQGPDERDAAELIPHTEECVRRMRAAASRGQAQMACVCPARQGRRNALYLIRRTRRMAYIDAYAKIRHEARQRAERAKTPQERQAYEEVAAWAESLEFANIEAQTDRP